MKSLILITILFIVAGCAPAPIEQMSIAPIPSKSPSAIPTTPPTPIPTVSTSQPDHQVDLTVMNEFASAWNSHDPVTIRALYTEDARYFTEEQMQKLSNEESIDVLVSDAGFVDHVRRYEGYKIRILGEPIEIYTKLVAFAYRWENENKEGYNGVALLRYEGGRIFLHVDVVSPQQTPAEGNEPGAIPSTKLKDLMKAWNDGDLTAAGKLYGENPLVLSDEDLAQAPWRDHIQPPQLKDVLNQFAGWNPVLISDPLIIGDMVIFSWRWNLDYMDYPFGHGVRLLHYKDSLIATDIRFAIRPWENNGNPFMNP